MAYRSAITLYHESRCVAGHSVRLVIAEKDISVVQHNTTREGRSEDLLLLNPYDEVLTLVDRDIAIYEPQIMLEYLDERFPHPPLMPVDPLGRATNRQVRARIQRDLYPLVKAMQGGGNSGAEAGRVLKDHITALSPAFASGPYLMHSEFSLADCVMVPILWHLQNAGIQLPPAAKPVSTYAEKMFRRPCFQQSLSGVARV
jgi:stringent starvation protein A